MIRHLLRPEVENSKTKNTMTVLKQIKRRATVGARTATRYAAFTLIELLVVMAITSILLGLIFGPMIQGFNLTNRTRVQVQAQDTARLGMEIGMRDVSNGVFVFDNTQEPINLWVTDQGNNLVAIPLPYGMVDLVPPARKHDQDTTLQPIDIDPTTGLAIVRGDIALPLAPGRVIYRYFLGLRDNTVVNGSRPNKPYVNYFDNPRASTLQQHNPVILYRAVISPYLPNGQVDTRFFKQDPNTGAPILYDSNFFYDSTDPGSGLPAIPGFTSKNTGYQARGYGQIWENWRSISRPLVPTDRADEVVVNRDDNGNIVFVGGLPQVTPQVRFQPTYVGNDAGTPTSTGDAANGAPETQTEKLPPSTHVETYGHWTTPYRIYLYRTPLDAQPVNLYYWLNTYSPAQNNISDPVMDQTYDPTTNAITSNVLADFYPNWTPIALDPTTGAQLPPVGSSVPVTPSNPPKVMFTVDSRRGVVNHTFLDSVLLHGPYDSTTKTYPIRPSIWANGSSGNTPVDQINNNYNAYKATSGVTQPVTAVRYISLVDIPNDPVTNSARKSPFNLLPGSRIVPGSVVVKGPDMKPGDNFGKEIVYTEVNDTDIDSIGPNQYRIKLKDDNGVNKSNPDLMQRYSQMAGTIIFDSHESKPGDNHALPTDSTAGFPCAPITVTYEFQMNSADWTFKADYLTRQLMTFTLGVRLYEFNSRQPQQVTLTQKIKVRNLQR